MRIPKKGIQKQRGKSRIYLTNLRNQQKFGMINELKIRPASVENKNEQKVSVIPEMGQTPFFCIKV